MKKLTYATCYTVKKEDETVDVIPVEGTTIIPDADFDNFYQIAKAEAHNGEITVEDIPDPVTPPTAEERLSAIEDALCEMDAANAASIAALEDALCEMDMGGTENE